MKVHVLALALAATAFGSLAASAQTSTVVEERRPAETVVKHPTPSTTVIEQRPGVVIEHPATTTTTSHSTEPILGGIKSTTTQHTSGAGVDCETKTTHTTTILGSNTTRKSDCY
jgi:hypothetical protein